MKRLPDTSRFLRALLPPAIWFVCFSALYAVATLACGPGALLGNTRSVSLVLIVAALVALAFMVVPAVTADPFLSTVNRWLSLLAIVAICWTLVPLLMLQAC
jgi:hypothetical protein